ncbi:maker519 [Drosophila busckii]|uniref:Mitochondrial pyruvate carrier n=1 Tax=Drosophila busckii TaxID=30019 RepID=A0A0M4EGC1_DROBS|nr:maker518 [Drosophila busckii]ALC39724.1 maker519 [Drosophila busckii]
MPKRIGPLSRLYVFVICTVDRVVPNALRPFWDAPAGPRNVFFWAPTFKWGLVFAGLGDLVSRPPQNISVPQAGSLAITGMLWSRYSLIITPKNYNMLAVNTFLTLNQAYLIYKHLVWRSSQPKNAVYEYNNYGFDEEW